MSYWNDLLPRHEALKNMNADQLKAAEQATESCVTVLAHGISGIGHLLACTASNGDTGLNPEVVTDIGWLLKSLGSLVGNLSDTGAAATFHLSEVKPGA
ncbi:MULTISPECIES: hypothetical protein [Pseudomonas]|uniref:hypothetical protein n=1 Tax=Pseudomonas TaxID=286 RepID=UPI002115A2E5|nr:MULTISPECIES: hypothetical protein [Pseudomonas]